METRPASHPPADVLLALGSGKLDDATAEAIFFHVEVCPECLKTAGRLSGDSFLDKLRAARGYSGTPAPSKVISSFPGAGNTNPIPTTSERPAPTILPELRDHPQYEVLRELGRGGMGVVYLAKNKLMDRLEVLKVVNKQLLGDAGAAERFLREIRSAAQLNHPNIVTAYSALQAGELLLFSMEYVEGRDLAEVVKSRGPLPAINAGSYVLQAARGLQHAFEKGMVHRDIKPQNLILDGKKNIVKILDFGLAKATRATGVAGEGLTGINMMMGTPDYMAPEQARDAANVDIRADIYSLGCTLYCLLAGRAPFVGGSLAMKIAAHQFSEPDPIESLRQDLPPGLAEIVRKMMAKDPEQRYQKPDDVVQALTICFKGKGKQPAAKALPVKVVTAKPIAASKLSAKGEGKSIFERKTVAPIAAPRQAMKERPSPVALVKKVETPLWRKKWLMAAGGAVVALMLLALIGLLAAGVFRVKTADGILVVEVNEPNAEVYVDGNRMTVSWNEGGTKAEIQVKPGARKVEVRKDGFSVAGTELTFKDGVREVFTARLLADEPPMAKADAPRPEKSSPPPAPLGTGENPADITNSIGMKLKLIKPGTFLMGSPKDEEGRYDHEGPQHEVELTRPFFMGVYPVTVEQFAAFVKDADYKTEAETDGQGGWGYNSTTREYEGRKPEYTWRNPGFAQTDEHPVVNMSWNDAVRFCEWLSRKEGKFYELPTEAEWEYACRAGTTTRFWCGDGDAGLKGNANVEDASLKGKLDANYARNWVFQIWDDGYAFTSPVGKFRANPWGLYDMHGNVWQWCADRYGPYQKESVKDPVSPDNGDRRVLRGGSWVNTPRRCRSAIRDGNAPSDRGSHFGFRVVLRVPARTPSLAKADAPPPEKSPPAPLGTGENPADITNGIGMKLKLIKPGTFLMGSPKDEEGRFDNEGPQHEVEITKPFYMGVYPVTKGQFIAFAKGAPYTTEAETDGTGYGYNASTNKLESGKYSWRVLGFAQADDYPVAEVTWNDAKAFCEWLSKKEGKTYELPTEAEWEYACRAGTKTRFWCGDWDGDLKGNANIADASFKKKFPEVSWAVAWDDGYALTSPVGSFKANPWGLYDMHGNVWQWCADVYGSYQEGTIKDPKGADSGLKDKESIQGRVLRGGSWHNGHRSCRSAFRVDHDPAGRYDDLGFRVVLRVPARTPSLANADARPPVKSPPPDAPPEKSPPPPAPPGTGDKPAEITNGIGMKLKLIQAGKFLMGSPEDEAGRFDNEGPQHEVEITKPFYMGVYPVTKGQFAAFAKGAPYTTEAETDGTGAGYNASTKTFESGKYSWRNLGFKQEDDHPVVEVTWNDATAFCAWLSKKEGKHYELPTEAQWEYACRAGTKTRFWCGDRDEDLKGNANIADASFKEKYPAGDWAVSWDDKYPFTSPVGSFKANPWGLYDMHGNVWQWCADYYDAKYYENSDKKDPLNSSKSDARVSRGGSWSFSPRNCRSAYRNRVAPGNRDNGGLGLRVCLLLD